MKISVDTKEDSPEEIKKVIKMLQHLVGERSYSNQSNIFSDDAPNNNIFSDDNASNNLSDEDSPSDQPTNAFSAMFGDNSPSPSTEESSTEEETEEETEEKKLDMDSEIIPY